MATDLETRTTSTKSDAYLRRKFAELCARIRRVDLLAHLLVLSLAIPVYALFIGLFDWFAGNSSATWVHLTRWVGFAAFLGIIGLILVQAGRCLLRPVSPYFVAHQIEQSLPNAKNVLINWLDLHDEELPAAFRRNLCARAAEQLEESDVEQTVPKRKNWVLLGALAVPLLGLIILLLLGPGAFAASMLRAFVPFYTPAPIARTRIVLVHPKGGDAEIGPAQAITVSAAIEGRVPTGSRPDAPTLSYRYQANEDYFTQPLQQDAAGLWTTQLHAGQLRTGISYKLSAGDAETPEHQVRVRARAHVKQYEITYQHRPFRKLPQTTATFPNKDATRPVVHGPPGSDVELVVRASRPVQKSSIEIVTAAGKKELPTRKLADNTFACTWKLEQPGQFRVLFTSTDREDNTDRDWSPIDMPLDELPRVVMIQPGKDVQLPENGTLVLDGHASSEIGLKGLALHLRAVNDANKPAFLPLAYRPGKSFQFDDGAFAHVIEYKEVVALDQLKAGKDKLHQSPAGTVLEYWLEATDAADFPNPAGNIGKSPVYKVTLTPAAKNQDIQRNAALNQKKKHEQQQDQNLAKEGKDLAQKSSGGGTGQQDPQKGFDDQKKQNKDAENKLRQALKDKEEQDKRGGARSADQKNSEGKDGPAKSPDDPQPQSKDKAPDEDAGKPKDQGEGKGAAGTPKDDGGPEKKSASKGDRKDGPKETPGGAKDDGGKGKDEPGNAKNAGPTGMDAPMTQPKTPGPDDGTPTPIAKGAKNEPQPQSGAKGIEDNGPEVTNKDPQHPHGPPNAKSKAGMMADAGASKSEPGQGSPGNARGDDQKTKSKEPSLDEIARHIEALPNHGAKGDEAGEGLAAIAKNSDDPRLRDFAKEALEKNGRDPKTGKELKKGPSPLGSGGKSPGLSDEIKAAAANREFAARIAQMQLDDWKKRVSPELLKKAGLSEAEWQRYVKSVQSYDALVRQLNAKLAQQALKKDLRGSANSGTGISEVQGVGSGNTAPGGGAPPPPELRDPFRRFTTPANP